MRTFSRFFFVGALFALLSHGWFFASAQTAGAGPLLELPSGELSGTIPVRIITATIAPGPVRLYLAPPQMFLGELTRSTTDPHLWEYVWNTSQIPNGTYQLIAHTQNDLEVSRSVTIHNMPQSGSGLDATATPPPPTTETPPPPPPPTALPPLPPPPNTENINPPSRSIVAELSQTGIVQGTLSLSFSVEKIDDIEIFIGKLSEAEGRFIGKATRTPTNQDLWRFSFDTTRFANGLYVIGARVRSGDTYFWSRIAEITILNAIAPPPPPSTSATPATPPPTPITLPAPIPKKITPTAPPPPSKELLQPLSEIEQDAIKRRIREDISVLTQTVKALDDRPQEPLELPDSDRDGITDYDEKNIYQTNPVAKDSDKDGISDSIELLSNQDPNNATANSISYQDPKDAGVPRPEILAVHDITPVLTTQPDGTQSIEKVTITGRGPRNSLVTIYIFSTPFVVTVKTNAEGVWTYTFDKELADGDHEIYAAITDSKGSVLAKSSPVPFVKTANAISKTPTPAETTNTKPSIYGKHPTSFLIAIVAATIGMAFVVIGLVVRRRRMEATPLPQ